MISSVLSVFLLESENPVRFIAEYCGAGDENLPSALLSGHCLLNFSVGTRSTVIFPLLLTHLTHQHNRVTTLTFRF